MSQDIILTNKTKSTVVPIEEQNNQPINQSQRNNEITNPADKERTKWVCHFYHYDQPTIKNRRSYKSLHIVRPIVSY